MDITIQMRSLELLIKMLKRDMDGIPAYGYARQMGSLPLLSARESLPRCTPEEAGLSSTVVERFFRSLSDNTAELGIHSAMLLRHGKVFAEGYYAPYRPEIPHMLYSASKSVTSTAIGSGYYCGREPHQLPGSHTARRGGLCYPHEGAIPRRRGSGLRRRNSKCRGGRHACRGTHNGHFPADVKERDR